MASLLTSRTWWVRTLGEVAIVQAGVLLFAVVAVGIAAVGLMAVVGLMEWADREGWATRFHPAAVAMVFGLLVFETFNYFAFSYPQGKLPAVLLQFRSSTLTTLVLQASFVGFTWWHPEFSRIGVVADNILTVYFSTMAWVFEFARVQGHIGSSGDLERGQPERASGWQICGVSVAYVLKRTTAAAWLILLTMHLTTGVVQVSLHYTGLLIPMSFLLWAVQSHAMMVFVSVSFNAPARRISHTLGSLQNKVREVQVTKDWFQPLILYSNYQFPLIFLRLYRPVQAPPTASDPKRGARAGGGRGGPAGVLVDRALVRMSFWRSPEFKAAAARHAARARTGPTEVLGNPVADDPDSMADLPPPTVWEAKEAPDATKESQPPPPPDPGGGPHAGSLTNYISQRRDYLLASLSNTLICLPCITSRLGAVPAWIASDRTWRLAADTSDGVIGFSEFAGMVGGAVGVDLAMEGVLLVVDRCHGVPVGGPRRPSWIEAVVVALRVLLNCLGGVMAASSLYGYGAYSTRGGGG
ncbi:hypothetical protein HDU96_009915 [Phlyctochytrium bullatum]|nr:hypothetical protein HDU96_009915 [Phlyctochytrium bullatum]